MAFMARWSSLKTADESSGKPPADRRSVTNVRSGAAEEIQKGCPLLNRLAKTSGYLYGATRNLSDLINNELQVTFSVDALNERSNGTRTAAMTGAGKRNLNT